MSRLFLVIFVGLFAAWAAAAEKSAPESAASAESARKERERLKEIAEVVAARRVMREHESGTKLATDAELANARAVLQRHSATEPVRPPAGSAGPGRVPFRKLTLPDGGLDTLTKMCEGIYKTRVIVSDRLRAEVKTVNLRVEAESAEDFDRKLRAALAANRVALIDLADGKLLDFRPAPPASP